MFPQGRFHYIVPKLTPCTKLWCHVTGVQSPSHTFSIIFMGGNFREKLDKAPRTKFCGFKFRGLKFHGMMGGNMNFNL